MAHEAIQFDEEKHIYTVNDQIYPGVTSIIQNVGLTPDFSKIDPAALEYKRILGTEVHKAIELDLLDNLDGYDPVIEPYINAWRQFREDMKIVLIETETPFFSAQYRYCGKLDLLAEFNGNKIGLFDFKTTSVISMMSVGPQLAGYDNGFREWKGIKGKPYQRFAVQLKDNGQYRLYRCDNPNDLNIFLYATQLYHWKNLKHKTG
jgi:hypothetical protein